MVIHKLGNHSKSKGVAFSKCGIALHIEGGDACSDWKGVTCKNCQSKINHRKKPRKEECRCGGKMFMNIVRHWYCEFEREEL